MGLDQAVTKTCLVAGIGFRHETPPEAIVALIRRALAEIGPDARLVAIATAADRAGEAAIREAAAVFGLVPRAVEPEALERVDGRVPTRSARIERLRGVGSLAEAAALAVAGEEGRLVLERIDDGCVTCALAMMASEAAERSAFAPPLAATETGHLDAAASDEPREAPSAPRARPSDRIRTSLRDLRPIRRHNACATSVFGRRPIPQIATQTP